jgi:hypothetical protein
LDFLAKSHNMSDSELVSLLDQKSENLWSCWFDLFNKGDEKALLSRGKLFCLLDQARLDINLSKFDLPPRDGIFRDLRGVPCPNNRAKAQVELGKFIGPHDFCFWLDPGSPIENVPSALVALGFEIKQRVQSESINRLEQENQTLTPENYWSLEGLKK